MDVQCSYSHISASGMCRRVSGGLRGTAGGEGAKFMCCVCENPATAKGFDGCCRKPHLVLSERKSQKSRARDCSESWYAQMSLRLAGFVGDAQSTWVDGPDLGCAPSSQGGLCKVCSGISAFYR